MKNAQEIKTMLADRAEEVAAMLLPNGKRNGAEWCAGSVGGEAGSSLKVHLSGAKAGVWSDFSNGQSGDLLDLWMAVRSVDFATAFAQSKQWLGLRDDRAEAPFRQTAARKYVRPVLDQIEPLTTGGPVWDYLTKTRQLDPGILSRFGIQQMQHAAHGPAVVFPIQEPTGKAVEMVKFLAVRRSDGKKTVWATKDSKPHLFGWQAIDRNARTVVITEGEIDALTVAEWGMQSLSVPSGVKNLDWIEHDFDALARFEKIYICTDADEPGDQCAEAIAQRLGRERCYRVTLPGYKDANEAFCSGRIHSPDFEEAIANARTLDPVELRSAAGYADELWQELNPTPDLIGSETPWRDVDWRIRPGELTIWTGWSGHGKSLLLNQVVLHDYATTGSRVLVASFEMPVRQSMAQLSRMALGRTPKTRGEVDKVAAWLGRGFWFYDVVGVKPWRDFLPVFAYAVRRYGITRIVVDSLLRVGIAEDDYDAQKEFVGALVKFAADHGVHVHLIAHSRKKDDETKPPGKLDIRGTAAITDLAHNGWSVWRNKGREIKVAEARAHSSNGTVPADLLQLPSAQLACWKNRKTGVEPFVNLWMHSEAMQFDSQSRASARVYLN